MDELHEALQRLFALGTFRPGQEVAVRQALAGRDVLAVMPTGGGKSLIYQLGAMLLPGTTLVISPLVALMRDQATRLRERGLPAAYFESGAEENREQLQAMARGQFKLVLAAPERLQLSAFRQAFAANRCGLFAVDEAHCISQWGHDFRPDYRTLAEVRRQLRPHAALALTATATPQVRDDIVRQLGLHDPAVVVTGFDRPNILFEVHHLEQPGDKQARIAAFLKRGPGAGIVYVGTQRDAEELSEFLSRQLGRSIPFYHAGMNRDQRRLVQDHFMADREACVIATNAFGMGIDRADLSWVVHHRMPGTPEAYYQEAGRVGRDGRDARAILLHSRRDRQLHEYFISRDAPTASQLQTLHRWVRAHASGTRVNLLSLRNAAQVATGMHNHAVRVGLDQLLSVDVLVRRGDDATRDPEWATAELKESDLRQIETANETRRRHRRRQLEQMDAYALGGTCRRRILLEYFGDECPTNAPRCCDCCDSRPVNAPMPSATANAPTPNAVLFDELILACVRAYPGRLWRSTVAKILVGSQSHRVSAFLDCEHFGRVRGHRRGDVVARVDALIAENRLAVSSDGPRTLREVIDRANINSAPPTPPDVVRDRVSQRVVALGESCDLSNVSELIAALGDPSGNVRRLAASALGKLRAAEAVEALMRLLAHETGPQVRQYAIIALGRIGDPRAFQLLERISDDSAEKGYNRSAALDSLARIRTRWG